jgi:hypothetical protein
MGLINGKHIGQTNNVVSMAVYRQELYGVTRDQKLWRARFVDGPIQASTVWTQIGSILPFRPGVLAIGSNGGACMFNATNDRLWIAQFPLDPQSDIAFSDHGEANGVVAMTGDGANLYAATNDNKLWRRRNPLAKNISWHPICHANEVVAMAAIGGDPDYDRLTTIDSVNDGWLLGATNDANIGKIWIRDSRPFSMKWVPLDYFGVKITAMTAVSVDYWSKPGSPRVAPHTPGSTQIVGLLYTATANNELWVGEVPGPSPWTFLSRGRIRTTDDADLIEYTIESDAVSRDKVEFVLTLAPGVTWRKGLWVPDGEGATSVIVAEGADAAARTGRNSLLARQVQNGQVLTFWKATKGNDMEVRKLGELDGLSPGSRVTFRWVKD